MHNSAQRVRVLFNTAEQFGGFLPDCRYDFGQCGDQTSDSDPCSPEMWRKFAENI